MSEQSAILKSILDIEKNRKFLAEKGCRELFTTHGWKCLGFVTFDRMVPDESLGQQRRQIKGYTFDSDAPDEKKIFETFLDRYNVKSGELEKVVVHEDEFVIVMERKTFDLSDEEDNFQFIPNMHVLTNIKRMQDQTEALKSRIHYMEREKNQFREDVDFYRRSAEVSTEKFKTLTDLANRLTRENSQLQMRNGNLEVQIEKLMAKDKEHQSERDEKLANAAEKGTVKGMQTDDVVIHSIQKRKEIDNEMADIMPESYPNSSFDDIEEMKEQIKVLQNELNTAKGSQQT